MTMRVDLVLFSLGLLAAVLIICSGSVLGEEDFVKIGAPIPGAPATDVVYVGEHHLRLSITNGQNCSNWSVELSNPLFITHLRGNGRESLVEGKKRSFSLEVDPDADIGTYSFTVYLKYSTDQGPVNSSYDFQLTLVKAWRVVDVHVPDGGDHQLSVTFETFVRFHNVTVLFGGDGNVGVEVERIVLEDVGPGEHTVKTGVIRVDSMAGNAQEVSWDLTGVVENRTLLKSEYNIPVDVSWGIPGFDAPLVLMAAVGVMLMMRKGRRR